MNKPARPPHPVRTYRYQVALAHFAGNWQHCPFPACTKFRKCKGGPRGQFAKVGKPLCETLPHVARESRERRGDWVQRIIMSKR